MGPENSLTRAQIKRRNRSNIYRVILENPGISRQEIARALDLSLPTVLNNLTDLTEEGLVQKVGRPWGYRREKGLYLRDRAGRAHGGGFDITRHHITAVLIDLNGEIMSRIRIRMDFQRTDEKYMRRLGEIVGLLIAEAGVKKESVLGVGFGVPGLISEDNQKVFYGKILDFDDVTLGEFSRYISFDGALFNDADAAAYAEFHSHPDLENAFYVMLSNNVGGALIMNGQVWRGRNLCAAEIGHITLDPDGPRCYCGQKGCMDIYCAATVLDSGYDDSLEKFFGHLRQGEEKAVSIWNEYLDHLAKAINVLRLLLDCPIILGGYVGAYMNDYIEDLRERAEKLYSFQSPASEVLCCQCRKEAIAAGAALRFITDYIAAI